MKSNNAVMLLLLLCSLMLASSADAEDKEIRIGFVLPLSGEWAFLGNGVRDAALLAEKDLIHGEFIPRLYFEDNGGQLKESATAANRLISVKKVDAIISIFSGVGLLISSIAEKAEVLNFGLCSNTDVANSHYSFTNYITTPEGAHTFLDELLKRYSAPVKLGIFSLNEEGFNQITEQVQKQSHGKPIEILFAESYQPETRDFRSQIIKIFQKRPQVLLLLGLSPGIEIFAKQLHELHQDVPLTSIEAFGLAERKEAFNGAWYVDPAAASPEFEKKFQIEYGREITAAAAHSYATVQLLMEAFSLAAKNGEKPSRAEVVSVLHNKRNFSGVVGPLTVDEKGIVHSIPSVKIMQNGRGIVQGNR